jgi:hypothetical protein
MATSKTEALIALEVNAETGEQSTREYTADELKEYKANQAKFANQIAEVEAKATARESALAKLAKLGLTAEEIAAL